MFNQIICFQLIASGISAASVAPIKQFLSSEFNLTDFTTGDTDGGDNTLVSTQLSALHYLRGLIGGWIMLKGTDGKHLGNEELDSCNIDPSGEV